MEKLIKLERNLEKNNFFKIENNVKKKILIKKCKFNYRKKMISINKLINGMNSELREV